MLFFLIPWNEFLNEIIDYESKCNKIWAKEGVFEYVRLTEIIFLIKNHPI